MTPDTYETIKRLRPNLCLPEYRFLDDESKDFISKTGVGKFIAIITEAILLEKPLPIQPDIPF